jgi:hypothetical protein
LPALCASAGILLSLSAVVKSQAIRVASLFFIFRTLKLDEDQKFDLDRSTLIKVARYFARDAVALGTLIGRLSGPMKADEGMWRKIEKLTKKVET